MNLRKVSHISFLFSLAVLLLTFTWGSGSPRTRAARGESDEVDRQPRDKAPASLTVWHYVGRATSNFANGTTVVVGYFSHIDGVPEPFFNGPPSEAAAFFTFRAEVSSQSLPRNGDVVPALNNPGNFACISAPILTITGVTLTVSRTTSSWRPSKGTLSSLA